MSEPWLHFTLAVLIQFLLFIVHALYEKKLSDIPRILSRGAFIGIVVGIPTDLVVGKSLDLCSYALGFGAFFLILNGIFLYGFFAAHILLMQFARLPDLFIRTIFIGAVFEITNLFFRVWTYEFVLPPTEFLTVLLVGYFGYAILMAVISHIFLGRRFFFIDTLLKK